MNETDTLLIELGTEELPPKALPKLSAAFEAGVSAGLKSKNIGFVSVNRYATPRRLAVKYSGIDTQQADETVERRGPAVVAAFDKNGAPTKAALGFAKSCNTTIDQIGRLKTDKGEWLTFSAFVKGQKTAGLIPDIVNTSLNQLPIPKRMRWGAGSDEFVRPVHWLVLLMGKEIIDGTVLGITSGRTSFGHRFHAPDPIEIQNAAQYPEALESNGKVIADFAERKAKIATLAQHCATENDGVAIIDDGLLDEVTALVEWPVPICGSFDEHFLTLPREVLIASMQDHQKYFPLENTDGRLLNKFITIANLESRDPKAVTSGNERVIRPRLSDAKFFWNQDLKSSLKDKTARLGDIVFEKQLGTLLEKTERVAALSETFAAAFGADRTHVKRAAMLSRADLVSEMVGEFPELQGIMGGYYAAHDHDDPEVANALRDFYRPSFAGDEIPSTAAGRTIAVADRLDTLIGIFAIGSPPTGDKDPYALRRAALGTLRILIESATPLDLANSLQHTAERLKSKINTDGVAEQVLTFMFDRLRSYYIDLGYDHRTIESVLALKPTVPAEIDQRLAAVLAFMKLPQAEQLSSANKRISNLLKKSAGTVTNSVSPEYFEDPCEASLMEALTAVESDATEKFKNADYQGHLSVLATLNDPINHFFDQVMVMADDVAVRDNRLALLRQIQQRFSQVADISLLSE